ncbi:hypothetical protein LSAT2_019127 [Lamellibrachia satsuma]|nr:hypothetical protein LSAT2_019127 [Lamellibrachia satsuma]
MAALRRRHGGATAALRRRYGITPQLDFMVCATRMLRNMLKALGLKKQITEEQRQKYKELKRGCVKWQKDVDALRTVSEELRSAYETHKGDCALGRYEVLKTMIKEAGSRYTTLAESRAHEDRGSGGKLAGFLQQAKALAAQTSQMADEESIIANMTRKEMTAELDRLTQLLETLTQEYHTRRETFENLGK